VGRVQFHLKVLWSSLVLVNVRNISVLFVLIHGEFICRVPRDLWTRIRTDQIETSDMSQVAQN
jgi:hypothetical protein